MNLSFNFLNFCTIYESKGSINKIKGKEACFSKIFNSNYIFMSNEYHIYIDKTLKSIRNAKNNYCPFSRKEIVNFIRTAKKIAKFNYRIKETNNEYELIIKVKKTLEIHKYLLSYLRYLYEYPFNMYLQDTIKLSKIKEFKGISLINIFNLVSDSMKNHERASYIHGIGEPSIIKEIKSNTFVRNKLNHSGVMMNDIFPGSTKNIKLTYIQPNATLDYWNNADIFLTRLQVYKNNLKAIRQ